MGWTHVYCYRSIPAAIFNILGKAQSNCLHRHPKLPLPISLLKPRKQLQKGEHNYDDNNMEYVEMYIILIIIIWVVYVGCLICFPRWCFLSKNPNQAGCLPFILLTIETSKIHLVGYTKEIKSLKHCCNISQAPNSSKSHMPQIFYLVQVWTLTLDP